MLEGEKPALDAIYARLLTDPRHCDVRLLCRNRIASRGFSHWAMADAGNAPDRLIRRALNEMLGSGLQRATQREVVNLMQGRLRLA
ncbi:BLUF domain-containing protein [Sediminicoccus sp. KRV36]|uniref:BLUF domain-containing protein n=1 Tax=Sediminicoccus sp. KRV36 TaxID=3133721 RepID=UPI00200E97A8|nr:BLUF domain-containing protein [Sediminicoccus rosea]